MARLVSLSVLIAAIAGLGIMFFQVVAPFLLPLFLAAVAAVILTPSFEDIRRRLKGRTRLAAGVTTLLVMTLVLVPLTGAVVVAAAQAYSFSLKVGPSEVKSFRTKLVDRAAEFVVGHENWLPSGVRIPDDEVIPDTISALEAKIVDVEERLADYEIPKVDEREADADETSVLLASEEATVSSLTRQQLLAEGKQHIAERDRLLRVQSNEDGRLLEYRRQIGDGLDALKASLDGQLFGMASRTVGGTLGIVGQTLGVFVAAVVTFFIFAVSLYYFLADGPALIEGTYRLIPVQQGYQRELFQEFGKVVRSVVLATFLAATAQGIATTFALSLCGFDHLILLLIVSIVASLIPLAGTWLVWVPCAFILVVKGHYVSAALLSLWGGAVVGTMDNVIRAYVLNNDTKLHPLLALLAVLGGLQVMGIWGVFIGPIVASCLHALVKIFNHELQELSAEKFGDLTKALVESTPEVATKSETKMQAGTANAEPDDKPADAATAAVGVEAKAAPSNRQAKKRSRRRRK